MPPKNKELIGDYLKMSIAERNEECFIMTKKELEMADNATTAIDMTYEWLLLISGSLLGYIISTDPSFTRTYITMLILLVISSVLTIAFRCMRKSTIEKILKIYEK